jgi:hypothetical protein
MTSIGPRTTMCSVLTVTTYKRGAARRARQERQQLLFTQKRYWLRPLMRGSSQLPANAPLPHQRHEKQGFESVVVSEPIDPLPLRDDQYDDKTDDAPDHASKLAHLTERTTSRGWRNWGGWANHPTS